MDQEQAWRVIAAERRALADLLVHRLDSCGPLGLDHGRSLEPWTEALALAVTRRPTDRLADLAGPGAGALRAWATRA